jgi:galactonate dehydratase
VKITRIETLRTPSYPNLLWVQVHTDQGLIGLGETFFGPEAVAAYVHAIAAPYLLGKDPRQLERHWRALGGGMSHRAVGAEARGLSAIDIALWDLFGQSTGLAVNQLMGGPVRDSIRLYNTCAGYGYNIHKRSAPGAAWATSWGMGEHQGPYEDLVKWEKEGRAAELAGELLEMGITAMKIWPFDKFAEQSGGNHITREQLVEGCEPFVEIRRALGDRMEIAVELHQRWNVQSVLRIVERLDGEVGPLWYEDPIKMDNVDALAEVAAKTKTPITASEMLTTRWNFRELLERKAVGIVMLDPGWVGGLSEARKIAAIAETYQRPVAPHDCTGPVAYVAGCQFCLAAPNAMIQEGVRAFYHGWYRDVMTALPVVEGGQVAPPPGPGLGTALLPDFATRPDVEVRATTA